MTQLSVLTGDFIGSTGLAPDMLSRGYDALQLAVQDITPHGVLTRVRGDGWQIAHTQPRLGLRLALRIRAGLRAIDPDLDTRIALATGAGDIPDNHDLNTASGAAFIASGRALDAMTDAAIYHSNGGAVAALTRLADHLSRGWTQAQSAAIAPMLCPDPPTHTQIAHSLGKSRQAVDQALRGGGFDALGEALAFLEASP
ncbi:MarR family transcriptional regulator [Rhodobacteraceae bacterium]|nr:MarR family transcriptional regulator [Paracoccaceae bacterium]